MSSLSDAQLRRLDAYEALLLDPGVKRGVLSRGDAPRIKERHIADALRGATAVRGPSACDLGSGGGLPGVPLAIARPDLGFVFAERRANRADFLQLVVRSLALENAEVFAGDVAGLPERAFATCTARAFGGPEVSWAAAEPLLGVDGILLYWAGRSFDMALDVPSGARAEVSVHAPVAGSGPLVIMGRQ